KEGPVELERVDRRPRLRIEYVQQRRIRGGKVHLAGLHHRRHDDPRTLVVEAPALRSRRRVDGVEVRIAATKIDYPAPYRGRGLDADLVVGVGVLTGFEAPEFLAASGVEGVEEAVPAADVELSIGDCRR